MIRIELSHKPLTLGEIDGFLDFLFGDVAMRPTPLQLREAVAVARYLDLLSCHAVPMEAFRRGQAAIETYRKKERTELEREIRLSSAYIAAEIWRLLQTYGEFPRSTRNQAMLFLTTHGKTYFAGHPHLAAATRLVKDYSLPPGLASPRNTPNLLSNLLNVQGANATPYIKSDLSERIYAANHALKIAGHKRHHTCIASALNEARVNRVQRKKESHPGWVSQDVNERVKEYEKRFLKQLAVRHECSLEKLARVLKKQGHAIEDELHGLRNTLVDKWVTLFRSKPSADLFVQEINQLIKTRPQW